MSIDFPNNPSLNDKFSANNKTWEWNGTTWDVVSNVQLSRFILSDTPPVNPREGTGWFNTTTAKQYVYYDNFWVEAISTGTIGQTGVLAANAPLSYDENSRSISIDLSAYATAQDLNDLIDAAPETLDTLNELAAALGDDANFATTIANQLGIIETELDTKISDPYPQIFLMMGA